MVFSCTDCPKVFTSRGNLTDHLLTHSRDRVMCDMPGCGKTYSNFNNCRRHFREFHEPEIRRDERERLRKEEERRRVHQEERIVLDEITKREALERETKQLRKQIEELRRRN